MSSTLFLTFLYKILLECEIASKCAKTAWQVLVDISKQTVTPALVTYFDGVKQEYL